MTNQKMRQTNYRSWTMRWPVLCGLLGLALARAALAADPLYENDAVMNYTVSFPGSPPPTINATNFDNENSFTVNFTQPTLNTEVFETWNTVNYTNNGLMVANSPFGINGIYLSLAPGCGFQFDRQTTNQIPRTMAGSFYNPGTIRANSAVDNVNFFNLFTIGMCTVNATNIVVPGVIELGENSLMQLTGKTVDMTRGQLMLDSNPLAMVTGAGAAVGTDTNADWYPSYYLQPTFAESSFPVYLFLANSTPYFAPVAGLGTSNVVISAIFIENQYTNNVMTKVFWTPSPFPTYYGAGHFNIEWDGTYVDASSGQPVPSYLYLNDDNVAGSQNPAVINGIPANFTFYESNQELFLGPPAVEGYMAGIFQPFGVAVTNTYSYVSAQFASVSVATNSPSKNVTNYLAILPGRIQISADSNLDLSLAQISGQNYLSLRSPVQFNGSVGAQIFSAYSDINVGVTNGFMVVTNLMEPYTPAWSGSVQAWSARWFSYVTNSIITYTNIITPVSTNYFTVTNDYRVLLVNSALTPTTPSQVQDLTLHAATNLVISDVFNIMRSLSIDAQNLTLTTNGPGSASPDGELNMQLLPTTPTAPVNYAFIWSNTFPNLHNFTNSGAFRMPNINPVGIGSSASPFGAFINHGFFADQGVIIYANNFENDGWFSNNLSTNALGSFILHSQTATLTNGFLLAGGDISIATGSLVTSNVMLLANRSLTLTATNLLTDSGPGNGNIWIVGTNSTTSGINLPVLPASGDLPGTTITLYAPPMKNVVSVWAATNRGASTAGYSNNVVVGRLILDSLGTIVSQPPATQFTFKGVGVSNALYVDDLELRDWATNRDSGGNLTSLNISNNLVIYYAQARINGLSVAQKLNGKNGGHLQWVPTYAGYFSSTNLVYSDGSTNAVNAALAGSASIDSNGNGIPNSMDSSPIPTQAFLSSLSWLHTQVVFTNANAQAVISWNSIPAATNYVTYSTNLINWVNWTNFISATNYPPAAWPVTNSVVVPISGSSVVYPRISISPNWFDTYFGFQ